MPNSPPFSHFAPTAKTLSTPQVLYPGPKAKTCLIWNPFHGHLPRQLPSIVQIGFALLPGLADWQRQTLHPPQHLAKQPPRKMTLRQEQPIVAGMLDQPAACRSTAFSQQAKGGAGHMENLHQILQAIPCARRAVVDDIHLELIQALSVCASALIEHV